MTGQQLYRNAKQLIPGGTQLLSKRPEMFLPEQWPCYYSRARGVEVTDLEGNTFIDMGIMGVGACVLGYCDPDVDQAVQEAVAGGAMCTLNAPEEVELAHLLCRLHPWARRVRYARTGGEAMAMAVRIARAFTGRDKIAFSGYHGWSDWYLAANLGETDALAGQLMPGLEPRGVPRGLRGTALPFHYNDLGSLKAIADQNRRELAAIVLEPRRGQDPAPGFLQEVRDLATGIGAVLIFDEITTGFRATVGGFHLQLGVDPDLAVFAKAMANGYAMAAVIGTSEVMEAAQSTFMSSTNWTERIGPAASLATIRKLEGCRVPEHLACIGSRVQQGWAQLAEKAGLPLEVHGLPSLCHFSLKEDPRLVLTTLFTQSMLERGFLAFHQFKPSFAHQEHHVRDYLKAVEEVFQLLVEARREGNAEARLRGPVARRGFYRLTA